MNVRLARESDLPEILRISNWAIENTFAHFSFTPDSLTHWESEWRGAHEKFPWLVATDENVIGFAKSSAHRGRSAYAWTAEVSIYIAPEHHRRGIGRALYQRLFAMLRAQGFQTILAGISLPNPASVALHESFGFRHVARFEKVGWKFDAWRDVGYWQLDLCPRGAPPTALRSVAEVAASCDESAMNM